MDGNEEQFETNCVASMPSTIRSRSRGWKIRRVVSTNNNTFYTGALMDLWAEPVVQQASHLTDCDYSFMHTGNELVAGAGRQTIFFDQEGMINDLN